MEVVTPNPLRAPYVSHDAGVLTGAVVLRPSTAIDRLAPIHGEPSAIGERAIEQHGILIQLLRDRGVDVTVLDPVSGAGAESLIADTAVVLPQGAVLTRPSSVERRPQTAVIEAALDRQGVPIAGRISAPGLLDAGDVVVAGDTMYIGVSGAGAGLRARSNALGRAQLSEIAAAHGLRTVELGLAPAVLRLRNVFNFIGRSTVIAAAGQVDTRPLAGVTVIDVPLGEEFAAGVLATGERRVIANLRFRESLRLLRKAKVAVDAIDLWEFGKVGAGPFSLVLATKRG